MTDMQMKSDDTQEYSLLDLIVMLYKHRKLFIYTVLIITVLGAIYAGWSGSKKHYVYRQPVQLASYYLDGKQFLLQGSTDMISAVNNFYLPRFIEQYTAQHPTFNAAQFLENFSVQSSFEQQTASQPVLSNVIYFEYKTKHQDLEVFQQASESLMQQIHAQEKPVIDSLIAISNANTLVLQTEIPKLEKVGELLKSFSASQNNNGGRQELAMTVSTRETYLNLMSQSQTLQNVIQLKQTVNDLNQKVSSLTPTVATSIIAMDGKARISFVNMILLSFIMGIFIALLLVFIKVISGAIKMQLKLTK